jgi:hypothetical protein
VIGPYISQLQKTFCHTPSGDYPLYTTKAGVAELQNSGNTRFNNYSSSTIHRSKFRVLR